MGPKSPCAADYELRDRDVPGFWRKSVRVSRMLFRIFSPTLFILRVSALLSSQASLQIHPLLAFQCRGCVPADGLETPPQSVACRLKHLRTAPASKSANQHGFRSVRHSLA